MYVYVDPTYSYIKPSLLYSYLCNLGDCYPAEIGGIGVVENLDTTITVQAGTFNCIKYKFSARRNETGAGFNHYHYCSPGVGLIKIEKFESRYPFIDFFIKHSELELINFMIDS